MTTAEAIATPSSDASLTTPAQARPRSLPLGLGLCITGTLGSFFLMSQNGRIAGGIGLGLVATLMAAAGLLECLGLLRAHEGDARVSLLAPKEGEPVWQAPLVTVPLALVIALLSVLVLGPGRLALPLTASLLVLFVSSLRRPALFVFVIASLAQLPMLGEFGLWDPWETHYGEVAREILARDDWITLWWAQDELFRSKPIFIFWIEALTWGLFGTPFGPDQNPSHPEWVIRLPHYVLTMGALLTSYAALKRAFGVRPAVLGSLVLATTPYFFFLSHQAITDMPFVATMTMAVAFLMIALEEDPARLVTTRRIGPFAVSAQSLAILTLVVVALPQILYLVSRNITWDWQGGGFSLHRDSYLYGSAGNSGIPGNPTAHTRTPYLSALYYQPFVQGLLWLVGLVALVWMLAKEKKAEALAMFGFYLCCSFAWMAKGIPGFALPGLIAALYLFATNRFSLLTHGRLKVGAGILVIAVTGLPWYVAMYGRLGPFFTDRLFIHDHINRLAQGVHGDTGSIEYFLEQLGYGAFPWLALFPIAFVSFLYLRKEPESPERARKERTAILLALWAAAAFVLFNAMITKFHHYIFPAVPPFALLTGVVLDRLLGPVNDKKRELWVIVLCLGAALFLILGVGGSYGNVRGVVPEGVQEAQRALWIAQNGFSTAVCLLFVALGFACLWWATRLTGLSRDRDARTTAGLTAAVLSGAMLLAFAGRDLSYTTTERPLGHERFIQLFIYNYGRPFPDHLDYRPILTGFAVVAFGALVLAAIPHVRRLGTYVLLGTAFLLSTWALNVYMIDLTPHWSQRDLIKRYYEERTGKDEPLIAWQMNWKGENIYTGNRVYVFVKLDNKAITKWLEQNKGKRAYFVLEHSRLNNFKRLMGSRSVEVLTTTRDNNKFLLARAQI